MRVVVTLTTIPTREESLIKTIKSIQEGTVKPDAIYVNLPEWYPRFKCAPDPNLESKLKSLGVIVNKCKDYGSLTKLVPILDVETDPETLIIVLDDDMTYQPRVIDGLVQGYMEFKTPVGYSGIAYPETVVRVAGRLGFMLMLGHGQRTEILECAFGVAFPRKALEGFPVPAPMTEESDPCMYLTDDYMFAKFFDSKKIVKRIVCFPWAGRKGDDWSSIWIQNSDSQTHSLSKDGNLEKYMEAGLKLDTDLNPIKFPLCYNRVGKWLISSIKDDEHIGPWLARGVEWENWMRQDVEFAYKPGTDILDLGGNIGCNALMFSDYGPVHTFEPLFHKIIQKNIEQNSLSNPIQVYPFGLSSAPSDMNIYFPKTKNGLHNYGCCSVQPNKDEHSNTSVVIHLERLDDVYKGVPSVMKIDVEGHELAVLKGADATIRRHMPALIVEIHHFEESPVSKYIQNLGYTRCVVRPHGNYLFLL